MVRIESEVLTTADFFFMLVPKDNRFSKLAENAIVWLFIQMKTRLENFVPSLILQLTLSQYYYIH